MLTDHEMAKSEEIAQRLEQVRAMLSATASPMADDFRKWHDFLAELRKLQGNVSSRPWLFRNLDR
jgi:hypothetical protein